eukprot:TRINITY_DN20558_c0_g1_i1.p1 TRINITY_DN20558_c0_g1~~TRINITY_DN20558_c0_g1_i1.p1  ORF type:complete len:645 (+),score=283.20 TRINITY_DN20558_c0_g1_i1:57-1991(+)
MAPQRKDGDAAGADLVLGGCDDGEASWYDGAVRVCFKRTLSAHLAFYQCFAIEDGWFRWVDVGMTLPADKDPRIAIKVGDVVRVEGPARVKRSRTSPSGESLVVDAVRYTIVERWGCAPSPEAGKKGAKKGSGWTDPRGASKLVRGGRRMPAAVVMCNGKEADKLALYFDGTAAVNTDKHRLIYIYDSDAAPNVMWRRFLSYSMAKTAKRLEPPGAARGLPKKAPPPFDPDGLTNPFIFLHSVILRIFFVTEPAPFLTRAAAWDALAARRAQRWAAHPPRDEHRVHRVVGYPRDLEKEVAKGEAALSKTDAPTVAVDPIEFKKKENAADPPAEASGTKRPAPAVPTEEEAAKKRRTTPPREAGESRVGIDRLLATCVPEGDAELSDHICLCDGVYWVGVDLPRLIVPENRVEVPSGAYWKLLEVRERYLKVYDGAAVDPAANETTRVAAYDGRKAAIDVGASPGGWSYCCSTLFATDVVFAVDPAEHMHTLLQPRLITAKPDVAAAVDALAQSGKTDAQYTGKIVHLHMKGEEAITKVLNPKGVKVAVYVCDINADLEVAVDLAEKYAGISRADGAFNRNAGPDLFERPALVVLTFKNTCRSVKEFAERKAKAKEHLNQWLSNLQEIHLFANSAMETTVIGEVL